MAGFEPATPRLTVEVTHVFTTGKEDFILVRDVARCVSVNKYGEAGVPDTHAFRVAGWDADLRAEPSVTSARKTALKGCRPAVWSGATIKKQPTLETRSQTGNNRPGCSGPSF